MTEILELNLCKHLKYFRSVYGQATFWVLVFFSIKKPSNTEYGFLTEILLKSVI